MFTKATHRITDDVIALRESADLYYKNKLYHEAFESYKRASELGDGLSDLALSKFYYFGINVKKSYEDAFNYMKKAAEKDVLEAIYYLGIFYYSGLGTEKDRKKAHKYIKQAADKKYTIAVDFLKKNTF